MEKLPTAFKTSFKFVDEGFVCGIFRNIILMTTCVLCTLLSSIHEVVKFLRDVGLLRNVSIHIVGYYNPK
jgi:hypothetical protein